MILEGIISTVDEDRRPHVSALGAEVDSEISRFELRPFLSSRTCRNLQRHQQAVFHVTDDVEFIAAVVTAAQTKPLNWVPASEIDGFVLSDACRAYELRVSFHDFSGPRGLVTCNIVKTHRIREFFGFNRAKHAVLEAAILATRLEIVPRAEIEAKWAWLKPVVIRTGGAAEQRAFEMLSAFVEQSLGLTAN